MSSISGTLAVVGAVGLAVAATAFAAGVISTSTTTAGQAETVPVVAPPAVVALPSINPEPLPEVSLPGVSQADVSQADMSLTPVGASPAPTAIRRSVPASPGPSGSPRAAVVPQVATSATPMSLQARYISAGDAAKIVTSAAKGGAEATAVQRGTHAGYDSWAVTVQRVDGSIMTGYVYVQAPKNEVFDWVVVKNPTPVVVPSSTGVAGAPSPSTDAGRATGPGATPTVAPSRASGDREGDDDGESQSRRPSFPLAEAPVIVPTQQAAPPQQVTPPQQETPPRREGHDGQRPGRGSSDHQGSDDD